VNSLGIMYRQSGQGQSGQGQVWLQTQLSWDRSGEAEQPIVPSRAYGELGTVELVELVGSESAADEGGSCQRCAKP